ncbi:MAG: phosphate ABC transporter permease PstA [Kangiellaceae bacterium]|nr:phosphate ABC transporter permease PstA [Kangiellaceae bacterium]
MTRAKNSVIQTVEASLKGRHRSESRFRWFGRISVALGFFLVFALIADITVKAVPAFHQYWVKIQVDYRENWLKIDWSNEQSTKVESIISNKLAKAKFRNVLKRSIYQMFPEVKKRKDKKYLFKLFSSNAEFAIKRHLLEDLSKINNKIDVWVRLDDDADTFLKEHPNAEVKGSRINQKQLVWLKKLLKDGRVEKRFNVSFFTNGDSREPELAGVKGAFVGTILTMIITLLISFPLGVSAAIYLEEFAPRNRWTDIIEVNINNLAAVPSIIFGLLGLAIIINIFGLPRSAPLVGGIVLSLMTLPTIIIASRASIKAVPPSIREAALGIGASKIQMAFGHVLPMAMPGIMTGTIIGLAQALGETAPLLMIGMVAFIVDVPANVTDAATVLPVQIFLWADSPERAFLAKTSAAILVLLAFLLVMNISAALLRKKFENKR